MTSYRIQAMYLPDSTPRWKDTKFAYSSKQLAQKKIRALKMEMATAAFYRFRVKQV